MKRAFGSMESSTSALNKATAPALAKATTGGGWAAAFKRAEEVELEGERLLKGPSTLSTSKDPLKDSRDNDGDKGKYSSGSSGSSYSSSGSSSSSSSSSNNKEYRDGGEESEQTERGGFSQPPALAQFIVDAKDIDPREQMEIRLQHFKDRRSIAAAAAALGGKDGGEDGDNDDNLLAGSKIIEPFDNRPKQICRVWLKYAYLQIGKPCSGNCNRKHEIPVKHPESMYSDFAFKSLKPDQRQKILAMVKSATLVNVDSVLDNVSVVDEEDNASRLHSSNYSDKVSDKESCKSGVGIAGILGGGVKRKLSNSNAANEGEGGEVDSISGSNSDRKSSKKSKSEKKSKKSKHHKKDSDRSDKKNRREDNEE